MIKNCFWSEQEAKKIKRPNLFFEAQDKKGNQIRAIWSPRAQSGNPVIAVSGKPKTEIFVRYALSLTFIILAGYI